MNKIIIKVTKTFADGTKEILNKVFEGKKADDESVKFLKNLHDTKMNEAVKKAGINKNFSNSLIFSKRDNYQYENNNYNKVKNKIDYALNVEIENIKQVKQVKFF